jgi:signal transduction histidine kinase
MFVSAAVMLVLFAAGVLVLGHQPALAAGESAWRSATPLLIFAVLWGSALAFVFWRIARRLVRTAEDVAQASLSLAAPASEAPVALPAGDEALRLRAAFAETARRVQCAHAAFEHANGTLQAQIRQSTMELRQKNLALAFQNEKVTEANRLKSSFFANVSHELRTPLGAILALTEMLRDEIPGPLNEAQRTHLTLAYRAGVKLLGLINDVLDLSRIEAGRTQVQRAETAIVDVLLEAIEELRALAKEKGLRLEVEAQGQGVSVLIDAAKVRQVFVNLLGNAIKFTERGAVTARIHVLGEERLLSVEVEDTGPGIPVDEHQRIFLEFHRVDTGTTSEARGTGLGLAISKRLVHLMGGDIWVDSAVGKGSRFAFVIPLAAAAELDEQAAGPPAADALETPAGVRPRLLLVGEDRVEAGVLGRYFRQRGIDVVRALSEFDAERILRSDPIQLALVAAGPAENGDAETIDAETILARVRLLREGHGIPVIVYAMQDLPAALAAQVAPIADALFVKEGHEIGELVDLAVERMSGSLANSPRGEQPMPPALEAA